MPRIFIAVPVSEEVWSELASLQGAGSDSLNWARAQNLHITLRFLGQVDEDRIGDALQAMKSAPRPGERAFRLEASGIGAFPSERRASVVWVGVEGEVGRLRELQVRLETQLEIRRFPREKHAFRPHLTLARSRSPGPLPTELKSFGERSFGSWTVDRLQLVESKLRPGGPLYTVRNEVFLE